jgi:hypothetical protein
MNLKRLWTQFVASPVKVTLTHVSWFGILLTTVLVTAAVNIVTSWGLVNLGLGWTLAILFVGVVLAIAYANYHSEQVWRGLSAGRRHITKPHPTPRAGLILLVSNFDTARRAIDYHANDGTLKHVWGIVTDDMDDVAIQLEAHCAGKRVAFHRLELSDECAAAGCYTLVRKAYMELGPDPQLNLAPDQIVADLTGGTKLMTAGMALACADLPRASLEFVPAVRAGSKPIEALEPIEVSTHLAPD